MPWNYWVSGLIGLTLAAAVFFAMLRSWKRRSRAAADIDLGSEVGDVRASYDRVAYVATTDTHRPLERVNVPGLAFRGFATVAVHSLGVSLQLPGDRVRTIPAASLRGVCTARSHMNRAVEPDGLVIVQWASGSHELDTSLRFASVTEQEDFLTELRALLPAPQLQGSTHD